MHTEIQHTLIGFDSDESAKSASARVAQVIDEMAQQQGLCVAGLDGVTISLDYDAALHRLDRGYQATGQLTRIFDSLFVINELIVLWRWLK